MTIALTGGTGFVGGAMIDRALARGYELRALARREQEPRERVEWVKGDLGNRTALKQLLSGVETVIHIAGAVNAPDPAGFAESNVSGTLDLIEAAVAAGVPRFVFVSSLAARQPNLSAYGDSKARAERIVGASGLDWTIVRPPAIFGPRDREMFELFRAAKWGVVPIPPPGRLSVIHVSDLADLLLALVPGGEDVTNRVFEVDDGRADGWSNREFAAAVGKAMRRRVWVPHLSHRALGIASRIDCMVRRSRAKLTADRVNYMTHPDWVANPRMGVPIGRWVPRVDTVEALRTTAQWYRDEGWL